MSANFNIPLFPLSAHLLPGGKLPLRIFEPRYVRLVKEACVDNSGFGICMINAQADKNMNQHIYSIGTYVTITDFDLLDDNVLGITVEGKKCFKISSITTDNDQLRRGTCQWIDAWTEKPEDYPISPMDERLKEIFQQYPELKALYQNPKFNDPIWVIYRLLELLPVNVEQKQQFLQQKDCVKALDFLTQLVA